MLRDLAASWRALRWVSRRSGRHDHRYRADPGV